jgi:hypothetical protein
MKYGSEPGEFSAMLGGKSQDVQPVGFILKK